MKVLIVGANGFLGRKVVARYQADHEVLAADLAFSGFSHECERLALDLTDNAAVSEIISDHKPDLTILTAAMTNVDACEDFPEKAHTVNALGPKYIAQAVNGIGGRLIHISTDFIFDGEQGNYSESDEPRPISIYGKTKLDGERNILATGVKACICRTSVLYGWPEEGQRDNFFSWAYKALTAGKRLTIIDGQTTTPTVADDLADCLYWLRNFESPGVYHTAGPEAITRFRFVQLIRDALLRKAPQTPSNGPSTPREKSFSLGMLDKIDTFAQKAARPANSSLNTSKIQNLWGPHFSGPSTAITGLLKQK